MACSICRASQNNLIPSGGKLDMKTILFLAILCMVTMPATNSIKFSRLRTGAGIRAKAENSSTIPRMLATWRTMVLTQEEKVS